MADATGDNKTKREASRLWTPALVLFMAAILAWMHLGEMKAMPRHLPPAWSADARYLSQAEHLQQAEWLGPYSAYTLVDRPGLSLFLARSAALGLGEREASAFLHVLACLLGAALLVRVGLDSRLALAAFALALFSPALVGSLGQRLAPEKLHADLALILVTGLLHVGICRRPLTRLLMLAPLGLILALDVITISDWRRLLPILAGGLLLSYFRDRRQNVSQKVATIRLGIAVVLLSTPALVAVAEVRALNERHYDLAQLSDEQEPNFEAALGALQRIARAQPSSTLDRPLRRKLYDLSPAFARLQPALESDLYSGPKTENDDHGRPAALLRPTIREATARIGEFASADRARSFFRRLADELNAAVASGGVTGLAHELGTDSEAFSLSAISLLWDRLSELWNHQFEDVLPGDDFARNEADEAGNARAVAILRDSPTDDSRIEERARRREGRLLIYRRILPGLVILAFVGSLMRLLAGRKAPFDRAALIELLLVAGSLAYLLAICGREASWYIDRGRAFFPLHFILPFWIALGLGHHIRALVPMLDQKARSISLLTLMIILGFGLARVVQPIQAAEKKARELILQPDFIAVGEGAAQVVDINGRRAFEISDDDKDAVRIRLRRDAGAPGPRLLILEAELPMGLPATPLVISWEGPARDERGARKRQLFVKDRQEIQRWTIAVEGRRLGDLTIRSPDRPQLVIRPLSLHFEKLDRPFTSGPDPQPRVEAYRELPGLLNISVRGGERESRYEFFFSGGISALPRVYPERLGELLLEDSLGLHDVNGDDLRISLVTDADGNGSLQTRLPTPDPLPDRLFIQGLGTQHFTLAPVEVENRY